MAEEQPNPPPKPPTPATQTVRTYKNRTAAEAALQHLKFHGIEGTILELAAPPGRPALVSEAVRVVVNAEDAPKASKVLMNQAREFVPGGDVSMRRKPRNVPVERNRLPWAFLLLALLGAGGAVYYYVDSFAGRKPQVPVAERPRERYVNEDTNHDGKIDLKRYVNAAGNIVREAVDYDGDGLWDVQSQFTAGRMTRREVDLDHNGIVDEATYYDRLGRPFFSQLLMNGKGAVTKRTFYQEATEFPDWEPTPEDPGPPEDPTQPAGGNSWPFRILLDDNADGHFDRDQTLNLKGEVIQERKLEKGAVENQPPVFPK